MGGSKTFQDLEKMRSKMHKDLDTFCDKLKSEEEDQVGTGPEELEISIREALLDTVSAHSENNQESTPSLPGQQQELRHRVRSRVCPGHEDAGFPGQKPGPERHSEQDSEPKGPRNRSPGTQKPGESFCERVLRLFQC
uniref:Uncharacterized protein n=1 Tax=Myotis myotis TaxID=51298 RepID=A0A7J7QV01_MYOMY|nr:hypothetical protein mMyoMyo1_011550 [Myotis myotis]